MKSILFFVQMRDGIPPVWGHKPPKHEQSLAREIELLPISWTEKSVTD